MVKKLLGVILIVISLVGISVSVAGVIVGRNLLDSLGSGIDQSLSIAIDSLDTVGDTLVLTRSMVESVSDGLETMSETADSVSQSLVESEPLLEQVTDVVSGDVPDSLVAIQETIPNVALAAGAVDDTLILLNRFQIDRRVLGVPIRFNLGIDYNPNLPLDETVTELGESLDGLPEQLRELEASLQTTQANLTIMGENVHLIASDLDEVKESMVEVTPLLEEYIRLTTRTTDLIRRSRSNIADQLETAKIFIAVLFAWIGLNQVLPLYIATTLIRGEGAGRRVDIELDAAGEEE